MPKQIYKLDQFFGGLNNNADPRDVADNELSLATDVMVDEIGTIRTLGSNIAHDATSATAVDIEPGYGLFRFSHDRINGHLGEHLANTGDFSSNWSRTGDIAIDSTDATYTHSSAAGTLIQSAANRLEKGVANVTYAFTYTISGFAETITLFRILGSGSQFAASNTNLEQSNGTHTTTFTSHATDPDQPFTIDVTSGSSGAFNIDNVSLRIHDPAETGDDYLALADNESADAAVYLYSKNKDAWSESQTISIGTTSSHDFQASFYNVDGALRISDGNFGSSSTNKWYGYIKRELFSNSSPTYVIDQWYEEAQKVSPPNASFWDDNATFEGTYGTHTDTTTGSSSADSVSETRAGIASSSVTEIIRAVVNYEYTVLTPGIVTQVIQCGTYYDGAFVTYETAVIRNSYTSAGAYGGSHTFYFDAADTPTGSSWGGSTSEDSFRAEFVTDIGDTTHGITSMVLSEAGAMPDLTSGVNDLANDNIEIQFDWSATTGASGWNAADGTQGNWKVGATFIYDGIQESPLTTVVDTTDSSVNSFQVPSSGATVAPAVRLFVADWNTVSSPWNKRITGCNIYMQDVSQSQSQPWYLQLSANFETGKLVAANNQQEYEVKYFAQSNQEYYYWELATGSPPIGATEMLEPSLVTTFEDNSDLSDPEKSIISQFKSAVVVGRRVYAGGLNILYDDGTTEVKGDAMIKTPVNKFDLFPLSRIIEASVNDGDNIVKLEEYADRILQFKKRKMHLINVSQEVEFLEGTFMHKGVNHPAAVCKTDYGVAWINRQGCYLYDGQKVIDLLEKGGRQIIKESDWESFINDFSMIGYVPKKRQLIVLRDCRSTFTITGTIDPIADTAVTGVGTLFLDEIRAGDSILVSTETREVASVESNTTLTVTAAFSNNGNDTSPECLPSGNIFLYDMVTQSWVKGDTSFTDGVNKTNLVIDWNGDLVHAHTATGVLKWADASSTSTGYSFITKDIDFGQPGQRKKVHKVYVTYKTSDSGTVASNVQVDYDVDGGTTFGYDFADGTQFASTELAQAAGWKVAELKPDVSSEANNKKSFRLRFATDGTVPAGFKINDISCVYRLKHLK